MHERTALEEELSTLAARSRQRKSVDLFLRAALEGFSWAVLSGICGKLLWDSARIPIFFWVLVFAALYLLWDAVRSYREGRRNLSHEVRMEARVRELRTQLGIDP
jgi:uncharacterized membrane protein YfcA